MIVICILAVVAGADGPRGIATWAEAQADWLKMHLEPPHGIPSHGTLGRLLALLKPAAFQNCFQRWIASLQQASLAAGSGQPDDAKEKTSGQPKEIIAIKRRLAGWNVNYLAQVLELKTT